VCEECHVAMHAHRKLWFMSRQDIISAGHKASAAERWPPSASILLWDGVSGYLEQI
jgi:hypothetical protein